MIILKKETVRVTTHYLEFDGITIEIQRKPIKNMRLRVYPPAGEVRISAPLKLSMRQIINQVNAKRAWIHAQRARMHALPVQSELTMQTGECHWFLGQACILNTHDQATVNQVILAGNVLQLSIRPHTTTPEKYAILQAWYRNQMAEFLPQLIKKWQPIIGVDVAEWGIKDMKTRWGSCNIHARRIWLNLALIKKPLACLESVIVHEMVHLLEASHNARFYKLMDQFMPDWRVHQQALKLIHAPQ